jgi:hypothetical protein
MKTPHALIFALFCCSSTMTACSSDDATGRADDAAQAGSGNGSSAGESGAGGNDTSPAGAGGEGAGDNNGGDTPLAGAGGEPSGDDGASGAAGAATVPNLEPVSAETARSLGAYARRVTTVAQGSGPTPVGWSMVNDSCQDRALFLQYAVASAPDPVPEESPTIVDTDIDEARVLELAAHPSYDVATLNVAGPLVTHQALILPSGERPAPTGRGGDTMYFWPYHHAVVLNVDDELGVLDLSVGDEPVPIDQWLAGFIEPETTCPLVSDAEYWDIWVYWNSNFNNFTPESTPARLCGYTITPMFTFRPHQTPADLVDQLASAPRQMQTLTGSLTTLLQSGYSVSLPEAELPLVTSAYTPGSLDEVCELHPYFSVCGGSGGGGLLPN